jgi:biotin carboxyl carrier protein
VTEYLVRLDGEEVEVEVEGAQGALAVSLGGRVRRVDVVEVLAGWYSLVVDHTSHELGAETHPAPAGPRRWTLVLDGYTFEVVVSRGGRRLAGRPDSARPSRGHEVRAPMPGLLVAVHAAEGATVTAGQPLFTMEAMKMQMEIRAPGAGRVRKVHAAPGGEVAAGQVLATIE